MIKEIEDKTEHLKKEFRKTLKKLEKLLKSGTNNKIDELKAILKKSQDIKDEISKLSYESGSNSLEEGYRSSQLAVVIYDLQDSIDEALLKIGEITLRKLEGLPVGKKPPIKTQIRTREKLKCLFCEKPLYDETVSLCMSCVRFQSKDEMLEYRNTHPDEVDPEGRLMRFPDLGS